MKQYTTVVTPEQRVHAREYAETRDVSVYARRDLQTNNEKCVEDAEYGLLGEFAVWNALRDRYLLSPVKTRILKKKNVSFAPDFTTASGLTVSVKTCRRLHRGIGLGWVFQKKDPGTDIVALVDMVFCPNAIIYVLPYDQLIYTKMYVKNLQATKHAVHLKNLLTSK